MTDPAITPDHYGGPLNPYEVIKVCEAWGLDNDAYLFQALKYVARAGKKADKGLTEAQTRLRDYRKAEFYLIRRMGRQSLWSRVHAAIMGCLKDTTIRVDGPEQYDPRAVSTAWGFTPASGLDRFVEQIANQNARSALKLIQSEIRFIESQEPGEE